MSRIDMETILKILEAFENYVYLISYIGEDFGKVRYYKRRFSFLKDHLFNILKEGFLDNQNLYDLSDLTNNRFLDQNIISKIREVINGGISKFKEKAINFFLKNIFGIEFNFLSFPNLPYDIYNLRDLSIIKDKEEFYRDVYSYLRDLGIVVGYNFLKEKLKEQIDLFLNSYYNLGFYYKINGIYNFIKQRLKGVEFIESGSIARFDKFIENICIIFPFEVSDIFSWFKSNLGDIIPFVLDFKEEVHDVGKILYFRLSLCEVPFIFVFSSNYLPFHLYFLLGDRVYNDKLSSLGFKIGEQNLSSFVNNHIWKSFARIEDFYFYLGINPIPYELIDYPLIFDIAKDYDFSDLVDINDIKGDLHLHTNFSDGKNSVYQIVDYARRKGYSYVGISDHIDYLEQNFESYAEFKELGDFFIFWAVEENIDKNGILFHEKNKNLKKLINKLDYINLSIHSDFRLDQKSNYSRVIKALDKGLILCHPTSRILDQRPSISFNLEDLFNIFDYAKANGKFIELNSHLDRLDIDYDYIIKYRFLKGKEVEIVINTDAHSLDQMDYMVFGVKWARKAMCKKKNVLNTKTVDQLKDAIHRNSKTR